MGKSTKKQRSQDQTIQRTVTSRNVTQDNGNIKNLWKGSRWSSIPEGLLLFLTTRIKKMADWKTTFVSERLNKDQTQLTKFLHSLHALPVAVLAILANSAARAKHAANT